MTDTLDGIKKITTNESVSDVKIDPEKYDDATIVAVAKKSGDTVEHVKQILGLYEKKPDGTITGNDGDKLLAGKYKTEGDLDKGIKSLIDKYGKEEAYKMLESKMGSKLTPADADTDKGDGSVDKKDALSIKNEKKTQNTDQKKIDMNKYFDEYSEKNGLSIESYKELANAGFDKVLVDGFIEGQLAKVELFTNQVYNMSGGETQFNSMVEWGSKNLNNAQKEMFNNAVNSGNLEQTRAVIDALKSRYQTAEGTYKRGGITPSSSYSNDSVQGFASPAEMSVAMRDPRYRSDPAYVAEVAKKLKVSKF